MAIAAAAQACGAETRSVFGGKRLEGLELLPGTIVETNFDPAHDRRLRKQLEGAPGAVALAIPSDSALLLGPDGAFEAVGTVFRLAGADADLEPLVEELPADERPD